MQRGTLFAFDRLEWGVVRWEFTAAADAKSDDDWPFYSSPVGQQAAIINCDEALPPPTPGSDGRRRWRPSWPVVMAVLVAVARGAWCGAVWCAGGKKIGRDELGRRGNRSRQGGVTAAAAILVPACSYCVCASARQGRVRGRGGGGAWQGRDCPREAARPAGAPCVPQAGIMPPTFIIAQPCARRRLWSRAQRTNSRTVHRRP